MPRSSAKTKTPTVREYLVRTTDDQDYARDPSLDACKHAANGLGAGTYILQLDEQLIPFGEPVYTVPDPEQLPQLDGSERSRDHAADVDFVAEDGSLVASDEVPGPPVESGYSPQAQATIDNVREIKAGRKPKERKVLVEENDGQQELVFGAGCACGCGETTANIKAGRSKFVQGHDQRLIGTLTGAQQDKRQVRWSTLDAGEFVGDPIAYAQQVFSEYGVDKVRRALGLASTAGQADVVPSTEDVGEAAATPELHFDDEIKVKIGRHERYARIHGMNQAGKVTAVRYTTASNPDDEIVTEKFTILD